ncbi:NADH-quinone oxidoreductase subunit J [Actinotalea fermentans]|uniref:NADH-quinone oxidoreductase subunit J n=1 Tax=Actinotalea fermentans TaxID=43671 RepID=A0A511Z0D9_9CELL|nr:NADH dehydrogenase [Actinotalea fermentans ATCC 43279 = JCM 9966 = DSM 3133]GEN80920.1 NADH:ubiquinone oxidoreductase subunit J [Actinotalea fermentans]
MTTMLHAGSVLAGIAEAGRTTTGEEVLFWILAPVMVLAALGLIFARRTVYAALSVILVMVSLAVLYVAQEAPFLGIVQVIVYTGAVMMLFLFVLMLVGVDVADTFADTLGAHRWVAALFGIGLGAVLISVVLRAADIAPQGLTAANEGGNPSGVARIIFGDYVITLQVVGILLITAAVGAIVLTHKERLVAKVGQRERADARIAAGEVLTPLPAPGVYARSNAMDVPALGPDGRPLEHSVSRVLRIRGQQRSVAEVHAHLDPGTGTGSTPPERTITGEEQVR